MSAGVGGAGGAASAVPGTSAVVAGAGGAALSPGAVNGQPVVPGVVASDVSGLSDPAVASLYAEAEAQIDPPAARRLYDEIDGLLWQDLPTLPLFQMPVTLVTSHFLVNVQESPTPVGIMWNAQDWAIALNLPAPTTAAG
jgi:peptide/nickel transport system substrate-binding protein